jgi:HEAT repeat protein
MQWLKLLLPCAVVSLASALAALAVAAPSQPPKLPPVKMPVDEPPTPQAKIAIPTRPGEAEERILKAAKIAIDDQSLLTYLRTRSPRHEDRQALEKLADGLGDASYAVRAKAGSDLKARGALALPVLRKALQSPSAEVAKRAGQLIKEIEAQVAVEPVGAVIRLLAMRAPAGTFAALFDYLPSAEGAGTDEEVYAALSRLAVLGDRLEPVLTAALADQRPQVRAAAAYVLARGGNAPVRDRVRALLADPDKSVQEMAATGLVGKRAFQSSAAISRADVQVLAAAKIGTTTPALAEFLVKQTPSQAAERRIEQEIAELGSSAYAKREKASRLLIDEGRAALPFLKVALSSPNPEIANRAGRCIKAIDTVTSASVTGAALRLLSAACADPDAKSLAELKPADLARALLAFVPYANDDVVEEEVLAALNVICVRSPTIPACLKEALTDNQAARRAAAALVLGSVGGRAEVDAASALLKDPDPRVRFRAAQGALAARCAAAVAPLIDLLQTAPDDWLWQVEELLGKIAAGDGPAAAAISVPLAQRAKVAELWHAWWRTHENSVDLPSVTRGEAFLGLFTIAEYDSLQGRGNGRVWECGRDGLARWELANLAGPMDGLRLPSGRVLVSEGKSQKVIECDLRGTVVWSSDIRGQPVAVDRLPNGNTFIACFDRVMEITPSGENIYNVPKDRQHFLYGAQRLKSGHVAAITAQGLVLVFDPITGREVKSINIGPVAGWAGIDALPNGHFLLAVQFQNEVREIDDTGKVVWRAHFPGVFRARKLPNGNIVGCSMTTQRVAELDQTGAEVWSVTCPGRPWNVRYR